MKNNQFDPENYTISVKKSTEDGEPVFIARVSEIPDIIEYADTPEFARELALDSISTSYEMCTEQGIDFPTPTEKATDHCASGRVTLRLPKSLHYKCISKAEQDGVSLNSYLTTSIASFTSGDDVIRKVSDEVRAIKSLIKPQHERRFKEKEAGLKSNYFWELTSKSTLKTSEIKSDISLDEIEIISH
ncbi:MAG: toxin-antitoxin system HicB family antitoxin [Providencia heimbachae]|nr:toxin-antitoxin system HicB family antitoxin [Providencia heimbachae]